MDNETLEIIANLVNTCRTLQSIKLTSQQSLLHLALGGVVAQSCTMLLENCTDAMYICNSILL